MVNFVGSVRLSSPERLRDSDALGAFRRVFLEHGGLGYAVLPPVGVPRLSEFQRLSAVPLVFGLIPESAIYRERDIEIKPLIRAHLTRLGVPVDDQLVTILKRIADQFVLSVETRRMGIADLKALGSGRRYREQRKQQADRCAVCGTTFIDVEDQLDHIVPYRLIGDIDDGANWQLLCFACNAGKRELLSSLMSPHAWNWVYRPTGAPLRDEPDREGRYVVLAQRGGCEAVGCKATPMTSRLVLRKVVESGLPIADHLRVFCEAHVP